MCSRARTVAPAERSAVRSRGLRPPRGRNSVLAKPCRHTHASVVRRGIDKGPFLGSKSHRYRR